MNEPKLVITNEPIDLELCELLGEKPSDFVILLADGKVLPGYGTPSDCKNARDNIQYFCDKLNTPKEDKKWWGEFSENWKLALDQICEPGHRPVFSYEIHRVCACRSKNLHCAIRLFEELVERIDSWGVGTLSEGGFYARLEMNGQEYVDYGADIPMVICTAVVRALRDAKPLDAPPPL